MNVCGRMTTGGRVARRSRWLVALAAMWMMGSFYASPALGDEPGEAAVSISAVNVPEPATLIYFGVAAAALFRRKRRNRCR